MQFDGVTIISEKSQITFRKNVFYKNKTFQNSNKMHALGDWNSLKYLNQFGFVSGRWIIELFSVKI